MEENEDLILLKSEFEEGTEEFQKKKIKKKKSANSKGKILKNSKAEILLKEEPGMLIPEGVEKTFNITQNKIAEEADLQTSRKIFDLKLTEFGPYKFDYTRNGRFLLLGGKKGHIAMLDWKKKKLSNEINLNESVRDVKFLHNETLFAAAQKKYTYIYDKNGVEIHQLKSHIDVNRLEFLPYHFLLVSIGNAGYLKYQDVSTGENVAELRTKLGACDTMKQNPYNAIIHLGHQNGIVTLWSPNLNAPLVKIITHRGPVTGIAIDATGNSMATCGVDGLVKIWDLRTYTMRYSYFTFPHSECVDISQRGLLAVSGKNSVRIWKNVEEKQQNLYMRHKLPSSEELISDLHFCPYEDVLGLSHTHGYSSIVIPGSGEPNFDTFEANPFETKKQRQENEVKKLLEKLQPEMITLEPNFIGNVDRAPKEVIQEERRIAAEANNQAKQKGKEKNKKIKPTKVEQKKQQKVWQENRTKLASLTQIQRKRKRSSKEPKETSVLDRFKKRKI